MTAVLALLLPPERAVVTLIPCGARAQRGDARSARSLRRRGADGGRWREGSQAYARNSSRLVAAAAVRLQPKRTRSTAGLRYAWGAAMRTLKIFFHDNCFDGVSSAALFSRFYREVIDTSAQVVPVGMAHREGDPFAEVAFDADDHACVDFRFSAEPALRWWFDHHATAFQPPELRAVFEQRHSPTHFFDPSSPSCAGLIERTLAKTWSWQPPPHLREVAEWANRVDALDYPNAAEAVSMASPAQKISVFLSNATTEDTSRVIGWLTERSLADVAAHPEVVATAASVMGEREATLAELRQVAVRRNDVMVMDLLDVPGARAPGLLGYYLFPDCRYIVSAIASPAAVRISAGHNPWIGQTPHHHIGELCQRFGGGGHAVVGGVTLAPHEVERGRQVMLALAELLST
jgi:hypothetical protein